MSSDTVEKSAYNEAAFKMARINECQRRINYVNQDLLKYYHELFGFGYRVKMSELKNLLMECYGKMDDTQKKKINDYLKLMDNLLRYFPFRTINKIVTIKGLKSVSNFNDENFDNFRKILDEVHMYSQEIIELAGYSTFTMEGDDEDDPYN
jgi:hypothetical protein